MQLFAVKAVHTLVFAVETAAIGLVWAAVLAGVSGPLVTLAVVAIVLEGVVYFANGLRCPMTGWAKALGDPTGDDFVADIFLPQWFVPLIFPVCGGLAAIGLVSLAALALLG